MLNSYRWCRCSMTRISFDFLWWCLRNFGSIFEFAELLWHALVDFLVEFRWTCDGISKDRLSIVVALGWTTWTIHPLDVNQFMDNIINECIDRFALKRYLVGASGLQISLPRFSVYALAPSASRRGRRTASRLRWASARGSTLPPSSRNASCRMVSVFQCTLRIWTPSKYSPEVSQASKR